MLEGEHPGEFEYIRPYVAGLNYRESFWKTGDETSSVWSCGQSIGLIDDVPTCAELVSKIMKDCEQALRLPQCGEAKMAKL